MRAGYHQIRLAHGEEYKTAFQTHTGHYEFLVVSMGLTGGPNTFNFAMCDTLSLVLRVCAVVFFDNILIFSKTYAQHLEHLAQVLSLLEQHKWHVKLSKCAFAQTKISYLGHVISGEGQTLPRSLLFKIGQF